MQANYNNNDLKQLPPAAKQTLTDFESAVQIRYRGNNGLTCASNNQKGDRCGQPASKKSIFCFTHEKAAIPNFLCTLELTRNTDFLEKYGINVEKDKASLVRKARREAETEKKEQQQFYWQQEESSSSSDESSNDESSSGEEEVQEKKKKYTNPFNYFFNEDNEEEFVKPTKKVAVEGKKKVKKVKNAANDNNKTKKKSHKCHGKKTDGARCRNNVKHASGFCHLHRKD